MSYQPNEDRRWSYEDYETNRARTRRSPLGVIGIVLLVLLVVAIIGLSIFGVSALLQDKSAALFGRGSASGEPASSLEPESSQSEPAAEASSAPGSRASSPEQSLTIIDRPSATEEQASGELTTVEIVERVRPAVVGVLVYTQKSSISPSGWGSGIIMSEDGYILTNAHMVSDATAVSVELDNGDSYVADVIGYDTKTDLAVMKIDAEGLTPAEFGNSDELRVGERVVVIGNPGGRELAGSAAQGIVSGVNRSIYADSYSTSYIQTDAAINPGNSGGALANAYGQVVGISSARLASYDYENICFAIPINEAKPIVDDLIENGRVTGRAKIGFSGQAINEALSQINNIPVGIYVWSIEAESDLATKDVQRGDILTHFNGERIETFTQLGNLLAEYKPGDTVTLTFYRSTRGTVGTERTFEIEAVLQEDVG